MRPDHPGRRALLHGLAASLLPALPLLARADEKPKGAWPSQPVRLVVPFAAGGSTDVIARLMARSFQREFGQPFVVDNRGGANGNLGAATVATAAPDGHTLMFSTTGPLSLNKLLYKSTPFDPLTDFAPVALVAEVPLLIAAQPALPAKNLAELIAQAKAKPDTIAYSTGGNGSMGHLSALLLQRATGIQLVHVPYKGSAEALNALLSGVVNLSFDLVPTYLPQIEAGKLRPIAALSTRRTDSLPQVPTLEEAGIDVAATGWYGLVGPKGLPANVVQPLNAAANRFLADAEVKKQLQAFSTRALGGPPEVLAARMRSDTDKWRPVVEPIAATVVQ